MFFYHVCNFSLFQVTQEDGPKPAPAAAGGILGALQLALSKRDNAIHSSGISSVKIVSYKSKTDCLYSLYSGTVHGCKKVKKNCA